MRLIKRIRLLALLIMALILAGTVSLWGQFAGGSGTEADYEEFGEGRKPITKLFNYYFACNNYNEPK